jgi:effector-binding domain-containing protein
VETRIAEKRNKLTNIAAMCGKLMEVKNMVYDVEVKNLPAVRVLSLREIIPGGEDEPAMWDKLAAFAKANNVPYAQNGGYSLYHDDEYKDSDLDVEIAVPVSEFGTDKDGFKYRELEALPQAATIQFSGSYHGYSAAIEKLAKWVEQNGYVLDGMIRGLAIKTYANASSEDDFLTELQVSIKKA